jgi:2-oxoglutarate dehydrogenase E1 component
MNQDSYAYSANIIFIEEIYQKYLADRNSVDASWVEFFDNNQEEVKSLLADYNGPSWAKRKLQIVGGQEFDISSNSLPQLKKEEVKKDGKVIEVAKTNSNINADIEILNLRVANLIASYKKLAHLAADIDPLGLLKPKKVEEITPEFHGISATDLEKLVAAKGFNISNKEIKLADLISRLNQTYVNKVGCEFEYINDKEQKAWLAKEVESTLLNDLEKSEKIKILLEIVRTEKFEQFIHKRFPGEKRFSVEGGASSICAVEKMIDSGAKLGVKKMVIGMAHRGRLNVLTGVLKKPYYELLAEFQKVPAIAESVTKSGDVKYHMGYANSREIAGNKIDLSLAFNPSHLEVVNSVAAGRIRAKQMLYKDEERNQAVALLIHGDAAFAGQGSVAESLMMNGIKGYDTGGVLHLIINNQIGFTANPCDSRSTTYASDLAKIIDAPIFHVNGDDVEAVVKIADIIMRFRQKFKKDIVLDLVCWRKYGHNEGDEPFYTQPIMYKNIKNHPDLETIYSQSLINSGVITSEDHQKMVSEFEALLNSEFDKSPSFKPTDATADWLKADWSKIKNGDKEVPDTSINQKKLLNLVTQITKVPAGFNINPKLLRQLEARKLAVENGKDIDWGTAEALAFTTLLEEGYPIRLSGQDSGRGTFSHRHSVWFDMENGQTYLPFNNLENKKAAKYEVYDSLLSEFAVLGFEYGYSLSMPYGLTIWEAQFGDFANGAQVIFDQFISSSEVKWLRKSALVTLLPHGSEGQGPEHSSARLERYLQLCADDNISVVNITNPANFFHLLRRQLHSKDRKPLIVMSPKSLLRHKLAVSNIKEFSKNKFKNLLPETTKLVANDKVRKLIICSGKVYYDLFEARAAQNINDIAIIRLEELYPFAKEELKIEIKKYKNAEIIWCQEEPQNNGAWQFIKDQIAETAISVGHKNQIVKYAGRIASASPATGYGKYHSREQKALVDEALK